jgi:MFS family permease
MSASSLAPAPGQPATPGYDLRQRMLVVTLVATFMAQFDLYVVNVALPVLQQSLDAGQAQLQLIVGGYAFTYAAGLLAGGRLGDHVGHRRMFCIGMAGFGLTSLLCSLAPGGSVLVACRMAQGLSSAAMVPQVLALITASFPPAQRAYAIARYGAVIGVGSVVGQVIGGVLLQWSIPGVGWRIIFLVNVPIALVTVVLATRYLPAATRRTGARIDVAGLVAIVAALGLVLFPLIVGRTSGWPLWSWLLLAAAVPMGLSVVVIERRVTAGGGDPTVPLALFREPAFDLGLLLAVLQFSAFFSWAFCMTLLTQDGLGVHPLTAGLVFAPAGVGFATSSIGGKRIVATYGARAIVAASGLVGLATLGFALMLHVLGTSVNAWEVAMPGLLIGLGNGIGIPAVLGQVLGRIPPAVAGAASGVLTTTQQFAAALGIAAIGGVFFHALDNRSGVGAYSHAMQVMLLWDTALLAVAVVVAVRLASITPQAGTRSTPTHTTQAESERTS